MPAPIASDGEKTPPALAATTMLMHASATKRGSSRPTASTTAHITSAVVRLSISGDRKNASAPVAQNSARYPSPLRSNHTRRASNRPRSLIALT